MPHLTENDLKLVQTILTAMTSPIFKHIDYVKVAEAHNYVDQSSARRSARKLLQKLAGKEGKVELNPSAGKKRDRTAVEEGQAKDSEAVAPKKAKRAKKASKTAPAEPFVLQSEDDDEEQPNAAAEGTQDLLSGEFEEHA
ncbi:hypothetical protein N7G274_005556 [Stereocaulon virgatum]|uniref:Uncharacterized protein n=1 Tax=Stereocaulon virgatum TaxID=373712 RepID=A0ABR4A782_9LECA